MAMDACFRRLKEPVFVNGRTAEPSACMAAAILKRFPGSIGVLLPLSQMTPHSLELQDTSILHVAAVSICLCF